MIMKKLLIQAGMSMKKTKGVPNFAAKFKPKTEMQIVYIPFSQLVFCFRLEHKYSRKRDIKLLGWRTFHKCSSQKNKS